MEILYEYQERAHLALLEKEMLYSLQRALAAFRRIESLPLRILCMDVQQ
jgi:hypothetical protein